MSLSLRDRLRQALSLPADIHDDAIVMRVLGAEALRQALVAARLRTMLERVIDEVVCCDNSVPAALITEARALLEEV